MATATAAPTMSNELFQASQEFLSCTISQRKWLLLFLETQDANLAARTIYKAPGGAKGDAYVAMLTRKIETSPRVLAALDLYYNRSPRDKFLRELQTDIARAKGIAKIEGRRLYAKVTGLIDGAPEETEPRFKVGDIATLDGKRYRVTAIREDGTVSEADPL